MSLTGLGTDLGQVPWELRAGPMGMFPPDGHLCNFHEKMKYRQCGTTMISRKNKKEKKRKKGKKMSKRRSHHSAAGKPGRVVSAHCPIHQIQET